jgi:ribosomal-protein-alanine N-acetyltransferase
LLRPWRDADLEPLVALNTDPEVMRFLLPPADRAAVAASMARIRAHFAVHGFGFWALEVPDQAPFVGFVGLQNVPFEAHFTPAVEIGWRLARACWGLGYATEGASAVLDFGFDRLGLEEIVAFTVPANQRSRRVMERLGMQHDPSGDFDHPRLPKGHQLRRHVLYRMARAQRPR